MIKVGLILSEKKVSRILKLSSCSSEREWFEADDVVDVYKGAGDIEVEAEVGGVDGGMDDRVDLDQVPCLVGMDCVF